MSYLGCEPVLKQMADRIATLEAVIEDVQKQRNEYQKMYAAVNDKVAEYHTKVPALERELLDAREAVVTLSHHRAGDGSCGCNQCINADRQIQLALARAQGGENSG